MIRTSCSANISIINYIFSGQIMTVTFISIDPSKYYSLKTKIVTILSSEGILVTVVQTAGSCYCNIIVNHKPLSDLNFATV